MVIYSPDQEAHTAGTRSSEIVSSLDIAPSILEWTGVSYPKNATANLRPAALLGQSFLPLLGGDTSPATPRAAYASHNYHSLYAYYPMRAVVEGNFRFVHNIAHGLSFGILEDVFDTSTWAKITNDSLHHRETGWIYNYSLYKHRPEFELYQIQEDPFSLHNLAEDQAHADVFAKLKSQLTNWRTETRDPWLPCESTRAGICSL